MDLFVCNKLMEWGLDDWIHLFQAAKVDMHRLYCLEDSEIDHLIHKIGPRAKFKKYLKGLKSQQTCDHEKHTEPKFEEPSFAEVFSCTCCSGKDDCIREEGILKTVKEIMAHVEEKLRKDTTELGDFLRNELNNLKEEKRELVGVFGQTGAGKSSLINAVIGEKDLLPTGSLSACTTVLIKVETAQSKQYEAEIDFIPVMEWEDELWSAKNLFGETQNYENDDEDDGEYIDLTEKLEAFYGDIWKNKSVEHLMAPKYFREIPEFLRSVKKTLTCETAKELKEKIAPYTRSDVIDLNKRLFWPLVKCVTVRVPNNVLLKHVTLVDLPGNGDRNKSRDQMWREIIDSCSTVWIVTNMNRAAADRDAWEILTSACGLTENGGICQNIHFICTKTDKVDVDEVPDVQRYIFDKNMSAKLLVKEEIKKFTTMKKHLKGDCLEVFTVSSKEFIKPKYLQPKETEIPKLREFLHCLNELHGKTLNYVNGVHRIIFLMKEATTNMAQQRTQLVAELNKIIKDNLLKVQTSMHDAYMTFDKCLSKGAENSRCFCQKTLWEKIHNVPGSAFHSTLKCAVENNGVHRSNRGEVINLNSALSAFLTKSIQEDFRKAFPNNGKSGNFYGAIHKFSLGTAVLMQKYKELNLQLLFIRAQEEKIKTRLIKIIRNRKKMIYNSLAQTVKETMQECYKKAAGSSGKGSLERMRHTLEAYIQEVKDTMFDCAKANMLSQLQTLMNDVLNTLSENLHKAIELSLTREMSIPDISSEFDEVTKHQNELMSTDEEDDLLL
ncbi:nuclear GTPase SLIP-GC-like isoform X2 [Boleophthalmus pectinirostris]|nr:nuclear GTPase SLIP-GC-like isoform X2 [Boleophthalmus pectinirostris]